MPRSRAADGDPAASKLAHERILRPPHGYAPEHGADRGGFKVAGVDYVGRSAARPPDASHHRLVAEVDICSVPRVVRRTAKTRIEARAAKPRPVVRLANMTGHPPQPALRPQRGCVGIHSSPARRRCGLLAAALRSKHVRFAAGEA